MALRKRNGEVFLVLNITPIICCFPWIAAGMWRQSLVCVFEWRSVTSFGVFTKTHFLFLAQRPKSRLWTPRKMGHSYIDQYLFLLCNHHCLQSLLAFSTDQFIHAVASAALEEVYLDLIFIEFTLSAIVHRKSRISSHGIWEIAARNVTVRKFMVLGSLYGFRKRKWVSRREKDVRESWNEQSNMWKWENPGRRAMRLHVRCTKSSPNRLSRNVFWWIKTKPTSAIDLR